VPPAGDQAAIVVVGRAAVAGLEVDAIGAGVALVVAAVDRAPVVDAGSVAGADAIGIGAAQEGAGIVVDSDADAAGRDDVAEVDRLAVAE
jgi:hypothetical protein